MFIILSQVSEQALMTIIAMVIMAAMMCVMWWIYRKHSNQSWKDCCQQMIEHNASVNKILTKGMTHLKNQTAAVQANLSMEPLTDEQRYKKIYDVMKLFDGYRASEAQALLREAGGFLAYTSRFNINAAEVEKEFEGLKPPPSE